MDPAMNTIFIFNQQMNNNCKSVGFGMHRCKDDMSGVSTESTTIFAQSLELWAQSVEKIFKVKSFFK